MLLQLSNTGFEIKIYFQLGMDFIHASLCGLSLPLVPTPNSAIPFDSYTSFGWGKLTIPLRRKDQKYHHSPQEIAHFFSYPSKSFQRSEVLTQSPHQKISSIGVRMGGIKWNDTLTISSMCAVLSLLIIWIDYKPSPRPPARITRN